MIRKLAVLLCLLLAFCAFAQAEDTPVRVMVATDVHYISPSLYKDSDFFIECISQGNGLAAMYSQELLDGLLAEVRHQQPDLLILTGDLTLNGSKISHQELADALRGLQAEGVRVAVIPGNHDIRNGAAVRYLKDDFELVDYVEPADFREIYQGLLAEEIPGPGFSGLVRASDKVWIALGDYSIYETGVSSFGNCEEAHEVWIDTLLADAAKAQAQVISASHQSLLTHTGSNRDTYCIWNGERVSQKLMEAGCRLNLSGHIHIQHMAQQSGMIDICTGAYGITPHHYAMVTVDSDGTIHYRAETVCPEHLPEGVLEGSRAFYRSIRSNRAYPQLKQAGLDSATIRQMAEFEMDVNVIWFSGTLAQHTELLDDPAYQLWQTYDPSANVVRQMNQLAEGTVPDVLTWDSDR